MSLYQFEENLEAIAHYSGLGNDETFASKSSKYMEFQEHQTRKLIADYANKRNFEKLDLLLLDDEFRKVHWPALKKLLEDAASKKDRDLFDFLNIRGIYSTKAYFHLFLDSLIAHIPRKIELCPYEALPVL